MTEQDRQARNKERLSELHPAFAAKVESVIHDLEGHEFRPRIQDAARSPEAQLEAYQSGHSKLRFGFHNVTLKGKPCALAVDLLDDDHPSQESTRYLLMLASSAEAHGLTTGIRWGLPQKMRDAIDRAILLKTWDAPVKTGWDPCHVEPRGMTASEAQKRVKAGTLRL